MQDFDDLDEFTQGYVECAYWLAEPRPATPAKG